MDELSLMPDGKLITLVRGIDPFGWQWRHRPAIAALLHELALRLEMPCEANAEMSGVETAAGKDR